MHTLTPRQVALWALAALVILALGWRELGGSGASASSYSPPASSSSPSSGALPHADPVVVVDVAGAVRHPGVYRLPTGARVLDAVRRAVPLRGAELGAINLAERLADGEQVVVPAHGAVATVAGGGGGGSSGAPAIVHLNSATLEQLETLDGIGPSLGQRILDYRSAHGGFRSLAELDQVSGIGPARLAALHGHVAL
jgi:competence protein ComEA